MIVLLAILLVLFSCAPKVEERVCDGEKILREFSDRSAPKNFRIYGVVKYGPLKFPMMLAKFDGFYTFRMAKGRNVYVSNDRFCIKDKCYLLPLPPESIIFGKLLSGREAVLCKEGSLLFRERLGVYEKLVVFSEGRPRELSIKNLKNGRILRVVFGSEDERGFFREIEFITESGSVKLILEEVEI